MKKVLFTIGFALGGMLTSFVQTQVVPLTIDPTQSLIEISIGNSSSSSTLSGNATLDIQLTDPPSGNAQITELSLVADDALNFSFFLGFVSASTSPGDVTVSLVTPGIAGTITDSSFDQLANML